MQIDELESRLAEIKLEIFTNYKRTVRKVSNIVYQEDEEEFNDHDYIENPEIQNSDFSGNTRHNQKLKKKNFSSKKTINNDNAEKVR